MLTPVSLRMSLIGKPGDKAVEVQFPPVVQGHDGATPLPQPRIGQADNGGINNVRVLVQQVLDFDDRHILTAAVSSKTTVS